MNIPGKISHEDVIRSRDEPFNFDLLFRKYPIFDNDGANLKDWALKIARFTKGKLKLNENIKFYRAFYDQSSKIIEHLQEQGYWVAKYIFKSNWRILPDLGSPSVYENGLNIFKFDGFPRISGSAIKGLLHKMLLRTNIKDSIFRVLMGDENTKSNLICFDAIPANSSQSRNIYTLDVMNCHYNEYYSNPDKQPGDWWNPVPITFLAIEPLDWEFKFAFKHEDIDEEVMKNIKKFLNESLETLFFEGLQYYGIGAKTNSGYGIFTQDTGVVKWFNGRKGYGFIVPDDEGDDVFVHYSAIVADEDTYRTLNEGDKVKYNVVEGEKGPQAADVVVTDSAPKQQK